TAAEVFGIPLELVSSEMRSRAKAVNFGVVYGISEFGLAKNTGTGVREAAGFIERYFARYPAVKAFMDEQVRIGKAQGYVETLMGRRRYLPELTASAFQMRSFGERAAMNSPIQGTAADIIKIAMVNTRKALKDKGLKTRLILQVHDELIMEAPEDEKDEAIKLLTDCMENAVSLSVPLVAEANAGGNWNECKP
ncbi:MAG: DNA polymerase I, partial [Clostridia bacterium]|nr:DNA polymerase I [Clostridia bacterium]